MRYGTRIDIRFPAIDETRTPTASCSRVATYTSSDRPSHTVSTVTRMTAEAAAAGNTARFLPSRMCRRAIGDRTNARKPSRSKPNWLPTNPIIRNIEKTTTPVAMNGPAAAGRSPDDRKSSGAPTSSVTRKDDPHCILISGARSMDCSVAVATADASSGTRGSWRSRK